MTRRTETYRNLQLPRLKKNEDNSIKEKAEKGERQRKNNYYK